MIQFWQVISNGNILFVIDKYKNKRYLHEAYIYRK
jgi:hypothetical protein